MRFLLLGINYAPELISTGLCNTKLAEGLASRGHQVTVVTASPYYPEWRTWPGYRGLRWFSTRERDVDIVRCPIYVPRVPTGPRRIVHYLSFVLTAALPFLVRALREKPDFVLLVAPSIIASPLVWLGARLSGGKSWLHVQDFEVGAAFATGLLDKNRPLARLASWFERATVKPYDLASSISPEMVRRLEALGAAPEKVFELRNWTDISQVRPLAGPSPLRAEWGIATPHVALYSGNIGNKQGIEVVVDTARLLQHRSDLTFVVCGDGSYRTELEQRAAGLSNILFKPLQPLEKLSDLLGLATVHLLPQKADAADLVLPSKLINMLASGLPVVATAAAGTGLAREVEHCGLITPPEQAAPLAAAIERLIGDPALHAACSKAARIRAEQEWDREAILTRLCQRLGQRDPVDSDAKLAAPMT